jgi:hypothetical protein
VSCGGVVCLVPLCEVINSEGRTTSVAINSEGRTTSVVCSEVIVFSHFDVGVLWFRVR